MRIIMHVATPQRLSLMESSSMPAARYPQRHEPVQHLGGPLAFDPSGSGDGLRGDWIAMCTELCLQGTILLVRLFRGRWLKPSHVRLSKNKPAPERKTASEGISSDAVFHKKIGKSPKGTFAPWHSQNYRTTSLRVAIALPFSSKL